MTREEIAKIRLKAASEHVENAQHELERAISTLSSLNFMIPEMDKVARLRDRVHEAFYRIAPLSHVRAKACAKATLDRDPKPGDEDPHKGCCVGYAPARGTPVVAVKCGGGCDGVVFAAASTFDVTTSGHTSLRCASCRATMVLL